MTRRLAIYAAAHFQVDLGCALLMLGRVCPAADAAVCILLYNACAFALQMPIGLLADRFGGCRWFAAGGCALTVLAWLLPAGTGAAVCAGVGNACFHVGGGLDTLHASERAGPLGLFVSPGAFGIYLGGRYADVAARWAWPVCAALLLAALAAALWCKGPEVPPPELPAERGVWRAAACLLAVVVLRSHLGLAAGLPWKADWGFWAVAALAAGKAAGGLLADRFGAEQTAAASLGLAALCYLGAGRAGSGLAALFLFNMTMPLTLWAVARLLPGLRGFSFGLLTFGLFLGFLPSYFGAAAMGPLVLAAGALVSLPPLLAGLRRAGR